MLIKQDKTYQQSGLNTTFPYDNDLPFSEYIMYTREALSKSRVDLCQQNGDKILDANCPFEWRPITKKSPNNDKQKIKNGILLVHGLLESPFAVRDIGNYFLQKNFLVRSLLLPGHGSRPGDLIDVNVNAWIKACHYGIQSMISAVENVYVLGISGGATLSLYHAFKHMPIKALILFAPAIQLKSKALSLAQYIYPYNKKYHPSSWYKLGSNHDYSKYMSIPYNLAYQAYQLTKKIRALREQPLEIPFFMAVSRHDETVNTNAAIHFFKQQHHPKSRLIIYNSSLSEETDKRIETRNSFYPCLRILNFSHICLPISPDNPHYGKHGDYHSEIVVNKQNTVDTEPYLGAIIPENIRQYPMQRLTYNPDFDNLMSEIHDFIKNIT